MREVKSGCGSRADQKKIKKRQNAKPQKKMGLPLSINLKDSLCTAKRRKKLPRRCSRCCFSERRRNTVLLPESFRNSPSAYLYGISPVFVIRPMLLSFTVFIINDERMFVNSFFRVFCAETGIKYVKKLANAGGQKNG